MFGLTICRWMAQDINVNRSIKDALASEESFFRRNPVCRKLFFSWGCLDAIYGIQWHRAYTDNGIHLNLFFHIHNFILGHSLAYRFTMVFPIVAVFLSQETESGRRLKVVLLLLVVLDVVSSSIVPLSGFLLFIYFATIMSPTTCSALWLRIRNVAVIFFVNSFEHLFADLGAAYKGSSSRTESSC